MNNETDNATGPRRPNRRKFRSHLVNKGLRFRLVWDDLLFALLAALTSLGLLYWLSNREIGDSLWSAHLSLKETRELLYKGVFVAAGVTFLAVLLFGIWSVIDAHRIAGPMHRLDRLLDEIADGNLTHTIRFRKSDEFQEIAQGMHHLVSAFGARIGMAQERAARIQALLANIPETDALAEAREVARDLNEDLAFFRTDPKETA